MLLCNGCWFVCFLASFLVHLLVLIRLCLLAQDVFCFILNFLLYSVMPSPGFSSLYMPPLDVSLEDFISSWYKHVFPSLVSSWYKHVFPSLVSSWYKHVFPSLVSSSYKHVFPSLLSSWYKHVFPSLLSSWYKHVFPSLLSSWYKHVFPSLLSSWYKHVFPSLLSSWYKHVFPSLLSSWYKHVFPSLLSSWYKHVFPSLLSSWYKHVFPSLLSSWYKHVFPSLLSSWYKHVFPSLLSSWYKHVFPSLLSNWYKHVFPSLLSSFSNSAVACAHHWCASGCNAFDDGMLIVLPRSRESRHYFVRFIPCCGRRRLVVGVLSVGPYRCVVMQWVFFCLTRHSWCQPTSRDVIQCRNTCWTFTYSACIIIVSLCRMVGRIVARPSSRRQFPSFVMMEFHACHFYLRFVFPSVWVRVHVACVCVCVRVRACVRMRVRVLVRAYVFVRTYLKTTLKTIDPYRCWILYQTSSTLYV